MLVPDIHRMTALARVKLPLFKHFGNAVNAAIIAGQRAGGRPDQFEAGHRCAASAPAEVAGVSQLGRTRSSGSRGDFAGFGIGG